MGTEHHPGFHIQEPGSAILDLELGEGHGGAYSGVAVTRAGLPFPDGLGQLDVGQGNHEDVTNFLLLCQGQEGPRMLDIKARVTQESGGEGGSTSP